MVTGTTACSPSCAVSRSLAGQAVALSATATCDDATMLTLSVPHSTCACPARNGPDVYTSHRPELAPDETTRGGGGVLTVTVLVSGCGPVSWTSRLVRPPRTPGPVPSRRPRTSVRCARRRSPTRPAGSGPGPARRPSRPGTSPGSSRYSRPARRPTPAAAGPAPAGPAQAARDQRHQLYQCQHDRDDRDVPAPFPRLHSTIFVSSPENPAHADAAIASCRRMTGRRLSCRGQRRLAVERLRRANDL